VKIVPCVLTVGLLASLAGAPWAIAGSPSNETASTAAFEKANEKMHEGMMVEFTGDADVDFVRHMIPHHRGAIDMAKIEQAYGKDPEIRKLATQIIKAQEAEIGAMNAWLATHKK
jgi:uncharacterized protein (DUF305 family)